MRALAYIGAWLSVSDTHLRSSFYIAMVFILALIRIVSLGVLDSQTDETSVALRRMTKI